MPWTEEELDTIILEEFKELKETSQFSDWKFYLEEGRWHSASFQNLARAHGFPDTWIAGGGSIGLVYFVGFWCGKDQDLICVIPTKLKETAELEPYLSPEGRTPKEAIERSLSKKEKIWLKRMSSGMLFQK